MQPSWGCSLLAEVPDGVEGIAHPGNSHRDPSL